MDSGFHKQKFQFPDSRILVVLHRWHLWFCFAVFFCHFRLSFLGKQDLLQLVTSIQEHFIFYRIFRFLLCLWVIFISLSIHNLQMGTDLVCYFRISDLTVNLIYTPVGENERNNRMSSLLLAGDYFPYFPYIASYLSGTDNQLIVNCLFCP